MEAKYEYRRNLPHYQPDDKIFFVTFCTHQRWTLPERVRGLVVDTCVFGHGKLFRLFAVVVMPDHVHLALAPLKAPDGPTSMIKILQTIKSTSAHRINKALKLKGRVWQEESFDRALRNEESLDEKLLYMMANPVRAGLVRNPLDYPWLWRECDLRTGEDARASTV